MDLFDTPTIERTARYFMTFLEKIASDADQRSDELPLLTVAEQHQLLVEWNDTAAEYPREKCVHELFEAQADRTPHAIAAVYEDQQITYGELNARANQLAHHLRAQGVGPDMLVGLCLNRSLDLLVGILGILKAGGAYVPLDANYPRNRLEFMLQDAAMQLLVATKDVLDKLPNVLPPVVCLDASGEAIRACDSQHPKRLARSDNLAYVIYTSGSTGVPKGVMIQHASIVNLIVADGYAAFAPDRVFLQLAPTSFDASTFEIWGALLHGAKLILAPTGPLDFADLSTVIKRHRVTTLWLTASLFNQIVEYAPEMLNEVEQVLTGGESLFVPHIRMAQRKLPRNVQLINGYGPTENTTFTTCYPIPADIAEDAISIPIGRPIANTQTLVLDEALQLAPIGEWGELYIAGDGLARGYLNRPELTAERFVTNPYSTDPTSRLFRTGDRVRWRNDGNLEFQGRLDGQVKLRGFRIELGEIEAALREHSAVADCAVVLREDRSNDKRLVAYWVPRQVDAQIDLRTELSQRLPEYLVPSAFVQLERLPLTANGKLDRAALLAPERYGSALKAGYLAPRNEVEKSLTSIWSDVLSIERVGVYDNFFALGGDSLEAVQVVERINRRWQVKLKIVDLYRLPTIKQLGELVAAPAVDSAQNEFLSILRPATQRGTVVWIGGHIAGLLKTLPTTIGIFRLGLDGMDTDTFHQLDVDATVNCYVAELLRAWHDGPLVIVGFSYAGLLAYALTLRLRDVMDKHVEAILLEPSIPEEIRPRPGLWERITRYCQRLWKDGPIVFYRSAHFRWKQSQDEPPPHMDAKAHSQWTVCLPYFRRNIASYRPPHQLQDGVHLIASATWAKEYLEMLQAQLQTVPLVYQTVDAMHLDLPRNEQCVDFWIQLIEQILDAGNADASTD